MTDGGRSARSACQAKAEWRARLLAARRRMPAAERAAAAEALADQLLRAPTLRSARRVAAYAPVGREPGSLAALDALRDRGLAVLLPVVLPDRALDWAEYDGRLVPAPHGLREPASRRLGSDTLTAVDAVLAPGLAVDRRGTRLGRGAGYYDRALAGLRGVPVAVLLYDSELIAAELPVEPHDQPVTAAITPLLGWVDLG